MCQADFGTVAYPGRAGLRSSPVVPVIALLITGLSGVAAGVLASWGAAWIVNRGQTDARADQLQAMREARAEDRRARAYLEVLESLWGRIERMGVASLHPATPRALLEASDWPEGFGIRAKVTLLGSDKVRELYAGVCDHFTNWVDRLATHAGKPLVDDPELRMTIEAAEEAMSLLEEQMNAELHPPAPLRRQQ